MIAPTNRRSTAFVWGLRILVTAILLAIGGGLYYWHINQDNPYFGFLVGGFPPSYQPQSHDWRLEIIARPLRPIIAKLEDFRQKQGRYPSTASEIKPIIPGNVVEDEDNGLFIFQGDSLYYRVSDKSASGYSISIRLGWDPSLDYTRDVSGTHWTFLPGDGSPDVPVDL